MLWQNKGTSTRGAGGWSCTIMLSSQRRGSLNKSCSEGWLLSRSVVSDSVRPQRRQPTRLPRPWDSPGKNTGVVFHFLLQCMKVKSEREVAQSCPTLRDPMDCSLPGSSAHGIFQARVLEWSAIAISIRGLGESTFLQEILLH